MKQASTIIALILTLPTPLLQADEINCPGQNTIEMQYCSSKELSKSIKQLEAKISNKTLIKWKSISSRACKEAYAPYKKGSIYLQMLSRCETHLNEALLNETKGLEEH